MAGHSHAVVWLDHHEARVIHFARDDAETLLVHPVDPPQRLHVDAGTILVLGPSTAKGEFVAYLARHAPQMVGRLSGVETMDKASDCEILDRARRRFARADRMRPQIV